MGMIDSTHLDAGVDYTIDGLPGRWRCLWADRSEVVFTQRRIRALMPLDDLAEIGPGHLRYRLSG